MLRFFRAWRGVIALAVLLIGAGLALSWLAPQAETVTRWIDVYMPSGYMGGFLYVCSVAVLICLAVPRHAKAAASGRPAPYAPKSAGNDGDRAAAG